MASQGGLSAWAAGPASVLVLLPLTVAERNGYHYEGTLRSSYPLRGARCDVTCNGSRGGRSLFHSSLGAATPGLAAFCATRRSRPRVEPSSAPARSVPYAKR